ncbi:MAG: hypothetical protein L0228_15515, partial [Planctomycetes bacterium]|nr:hypothetical protein [Planctomycetota bacterium]
MTYRFRTTVSILALFMAHSHRLLAVPIEWPISSGGNGHHYEFISGAHTWPTAKAQAEVSRFGAASGHLATVASSAENAFLAQHFPKAWIGLTDNEAFGGFESINQPDRQRHGWKWV